jgi:hypothetical protein
MFDYTIVSEEIKKGKGNKMIAKKVGKLQCKVEQINGKEFIVTLDSIKFVQDSWVNLFSINKPLKNGFNLGR